jgi:uncharacterized protein
MPLERKNKTVFIFTTTIEPGKLTAMKYLLIIFFICACFLTSTGQSAVSNETQPDSSRPYALVAGGSKGIGYGISEALAKRGYNLIIIARHMDTLQLAKSKLENTYHVHAEVLAFDLSDDKSAEAIAKWCTDRNIHLKVLCNVAGLGGANDYLSFPLDSLRYMVRLNVESCMALSLTLMPLLEKNAPSYILNVASMAGFAPIPVKNMYSATKSAVVFFSYSLRYQLKDKHISVSCLCPGPVYTKPEIVEDTKAKLGWFGNKMALDPHTVGEVAIKKTFNKRLIIVPGTLAKISSSLIRFFPRRWVVNLYGSAGDKSKKKNS